MNGAHDTESHVRRKRIGLHISWLVFGVLILMVSAVVLIAVINVPHENLPGVLAASRKAAGMGTFLQACLAMWVVVRWHRVVAWCRIKKILHKNEHRKALQLRGIAALVLVLYLLLIPIGPITLLRAAQSLIP